jgi:hypothetical protein
MSCGPAAAAAKAVGVDLASQAVIQGTVVHDDQPVKGAYVRLLDSSGEFTAEVPTGESGEFRFFAAPGEWTVRVLAPQLDPLESPVSAARGAVAELELTL